jgi:hypothetical protein
VVVVPLAQGDEAMKVKLIDPRCMVSIPGVS